MAVTRLRRLPGKVIYEVAGTGGKEVPFDKTRGDGLEGTGASADAANEIFAGNDSGGGGKRRSGWQPPCRAHPVRPTTGTRAEHPWAGGTPGDARAPRGRWLDRRRRRVGGGSCAGASAGSARRLLT